MSCQTNGNSIVGRQHCNWYIGNKDVNWYGQENDNFRSDYLLTDCILGYWLNCCWRDGNTGDG